jgi:predicted site-specific integrase-resolvase
LAARAEPDTLSVDDKWYRAPAMRVRCIKSKRWIHFLIAHKDRLVRFGFDLLDHLSREHDCEIIVVNQESLSPEQEMVEDLLAIVHTFSCRLYDMRKYKKQIKEDYPGSKEPKEILE